MSLDKMVKTVQGEVPECLAVGYVDMSTGMLLAINTADSHPREVIDLVAAATADLFQGASVSTIEKLFRRSRGQKEDGGHYFQEVLVTSDNLIHVFLRSKKAPSHVAVFVCRSTVNLGMALSKSRVAAAKLETVA